MKNKKIASNQANHQSDGFWQILFSGIFLLLLTLICAAIVFIFLIREDISDHFKYNNEFYSSNKFTPEYIFPDNQNYEYRPNWPDRNLPNIFDNDFEKLFNDSNFPYSDDDFNSIQPNKLTNNLGNYQI